MDTALFPHPLPLGTPPLSSSLPPPRRTSLRSIGSLSLVKSQTSMKSLLELAPGMVDPELQRQPQSLESSGPINLGDKDADGDANLSFLHKHLKASETNPNACAAMLRACIELRSLSEGRQVHDYIVRNELDDDRYLGNIIIEMYDKCDSLEDAWLVFSDMKDRNSFSWNNIIGAYTYRGLAMKAFELFREMVKIECPTLFTLSIIVAACTNQEALAEGRFAHVSASNVGVDTDVLIGTALINMYAKCGVAHDARRAFDKIQLHNVYSWTSMINLYVQFGQDMAAMDMFKSMLGTNIQPDEYTFSIILTACSNLSALEDGLSIHIQVIRRGLESNVVVATALVSMYGNFGCLEDAWVVFGRIHQRSLVSFTAMITVCVQLGQCDEAILLFQWMQAEGIYPNEMTLVGAIGACASLEHIETGKAIYHAIVESGLNVDYVLASALVNMFGKHGCPEDAQRVFDRTCERTAITWNELIAAYVNQGEARKALDLYHGMLSEGIRPTDLTFIYLLSACAILSSLPDGRFIHTSATQLGLDSDVNVGNALISMYGKCGSQDEALAIFSNLSKKDVITWNAVIATYTQHGCLEEAFQSFEKMQKQDVRPNEATFTCLLSVCSHAGLVHEGLEYFVTISKEYGMEPTMEHYGCMIDLWGRAGQLNRAEDLINSMPFSPDSVAWKSFLAACTMHGDAERARFAAWNAMDENPLEASPYVLLSNMRVVE